MERREGQRPDGARYAQARPRHISAESAKCIRDSWREDWGISSYANVGRIIAGGIKSRRVRPRRSHDGAAPKQNGKGSGKGRPYRRYPTIRGLRRQSTRIKQLRIKTLGLRMRRWGYSDEITCWRHFRHQRRRRRPGYRIS